MLYSIGGNNMGWVDVEKAAESIRKTLGLLDDEISKEKFIKGYCEISNITREMYDKYFVALPCNCGDESCRGWATISNNEESVKLHLEFHA